MNWLFFKNQNTVAGKQNGKNNYSEPSVKLKLLELPLTVKTGPEPILLLDLSPFLGVLHERCISSSVHFSVIHINCILTIFLLLTAIFYQSKSKQSTAKKIFKF